MAKKKASSKAGSTTAMNIGQIVVYKNAAGDDLTLRRLALVERMRACSWLNP